MRSIGVPARHTTRAHGLLLSCRRPEQRRIHHSRRDVQPSQVGGHFTDRATKTLLAQPDISLDVHESVHRDTSYESNQQDETI